MGGEGAKKKASYRHRRKEEEAVSGSGAAGAAAEPPSPSLTEVIIALCACIPGAYHASEEGEGSSRAEAQASRPDIYASLNLENNTTNHQQTELSTVDNIHVERNSKEVMASYAQPAHSTKASKLGVDAFDSLEWDPDLPSGVSPDKSPEPVPIKPKPVAYTTVGSLVNTKAVPQFTAPNRIQREGAQRKSLMSILHSYESGTLTSQQRGPPPPLNMANSMQYAQQLGRSPASAANTPRTAVPQSRRPGFQTGPTMSDQEKEIFIRNFGPLEPKVDGQPLSILLQDHTFNIRELSEDEMEARLSGSAGGAIQGLEKMQTLQRLSKFNNPLQKQAQSRLSQFSAAKMQATKPAVAVPNIGLLDITGRNRSNTSTNSSSDGVGKGAGNTAGMPNTSHESADSKPAAASIFSPFENFYGGNQRAHSTSVADTREINKGELDRNYEFPQGLCPSSTAQANPLYGAYAASTQPFSTHNVPPGYPKPLTAGPPGQRQFPANLSAQASSNNQQYAGTSFGQAGSSSQQYNGMSSAQPDIGNQQYFSNTSAQAASNSQPHPVPLPAQGNVTLEDIYSSQYGQATASSNAHVPAFSPWGTKKSGFDHGIRTKIVDTLSPEDAAKYFPGGMPPNMSGAWAPMSDHSKRQMGLLSPLTPQEEKAKKEEDLNDKFYYGYRRYHGMTYDDHINELDQKQRNPFGPIAPPKNVDVKPVTVEEMNKRSLPDVVAPMLTATFGTLTSYLDRTPDSRRTLSRWEESTEYYLDLSQNGNKSFFGEDWGRPQKRVDGAERCPASNNFRIHIERQ